MPVVLSCSCGKKLRVPDEYLGKRIKCPGCGKGLLATAPDDEPEEEERPEPKSRIRKDAPAPKRAPAKLSREEDDRPRRRNTRDDDEDEDERPRRRAARDDEDEDEPRRVKARKRAGRKKASRAVWPLIAAGVAVVLLLGGGVVTAVWMLKGGGSSMSEQAFIPPDGVFFASVQVQELSKNEVFRKAIQASGEEDPFNAASAELGMSLADVDRITLVIAEQGQNEPWVVMSTLKPYDRKAAVKDLQNPQTINHEGKSFQVGKMTRRANRPGRAGPDTLAVFFAGPKVLFMTTDEASMKKGLTMALRKSATGPLADAIKQVGGPRHLFGAFHLPPRALEDLKRTRAQMPPPMNLAGPMLDLTGGTMAMDFGDKLVVDANLKYADEARAKAAKGAFDTVKGTAALALLPMVPDKGAQDALRDALSNLNGQQSGSELAVKLQVASKALEGAIPQQGMGPGGGPPMPKGKR